jgi:branched-chain amino acid transport system permease protein
MNHPGEKLQAAWSPQACALAVVGVLFFVFPLIIPDQYLLRAAITILLYAFLTVSWNIIGGFAGQLSIGHSIFTGIGAYTSTLLFINLGLSPWIGMIAGACVASLASLIIGYPCFRLRGAYFVLVSIAVAELLMHLVDSTEQIAGLKIMGARGILLPFSGNAPLRFQFMDNKYYYYIILVLLVIVVAVSYKIKNSKLGFYLFAIKDEPDAAASLGINITKYKLLAFAISAFFTGMGGVFYAQFLMFISPERIFGLSLSFELAIIGIVGGLGTIAGPIVGAFFLRPISELAQIYLGGTYAGVHLLFYSILLMIVVFYLPGGIIRPIEKAYRSVFKPRLRPRESL